MDIFQRVVLKGSREMGCEEARASSKGTGWRDGGRAVEQQVAGAQNTGDSEDRSHRLSEVGLVKA